MTPEEITLANRLLNRVKAIHDPVDYSLGTRITRRIRLMGDATVLELTPEETEGVLNYILARDLETLNELGVKV